MRTYKRIWVPGGCYFFTVNLADRENNSFLVDHIDVLRRTFKAVQTSHPFVMDAIVVLPEHLHCIWRLPQGDKRFDLRWGMIKAAFSRSFAIEECVSATRLRRRERGIWQRRYWEHAIRDEQDWRNHVDYIHYNPVKHGHVMRARDWPHSSFHKYMNKGMYPDDWVSTESGELDLE